jgi:ATP-binding cassette subfamily B protein
MQGCGNTSPAGLSRTDLGVQWQTIIKAGGVKKDSSEEILVAESLRIFYRAASAHTKDFWLSLFISIGSVLISVVVPFFAGKVFAGIATDNPDVNKYLLFLGISSFAGLIANRVGITNFNEMLARTMADLHGKVFNRLMKRSVGYHTNNISGKLVSDAIEFVAAFNMLTLATLNNGIPFVSVLLTGIVIVYINAWQLGLFLTLTVVITLLWAWLESRKRSALRHRRLVAQRKLTAHIADSIVNAQTVKTFAGESFEMAENGKLNNTLRDLRVRDWQRGSRSGNDRMAALLLMQFCMILLLIHLSHSHPDILATGIFAFTYTFSLTNRLFDINTLTRQIEDSFLEATPMTKMLLEDVEIKDRQGAKPLKVSAGNIELHDVSFAYQEKANRQEVFAAFDLSVNSGEKVGLVGPSGGGKSTLTRLLLRFDEVQAGEIFIDGQDINDVTQTSLRQAVSYVPQEPLLFHRTIRENIAYGKPGAGEKAIIGAAKKANAHTFIESLPRGYETIVGERGVKLSGGQRQRVAIARAILKDAPILVLDEATSALDSENEIEVQKALWALMKGRTVIVVAHRLSTIQKMDRIVVLVDGKIVEEGPHKQLLKDNGTYARLWKHQSGGFIEA